MRRSVYALALALVAMLMVAPDSGAVGPGGWDHLGVGASSSLPSLDGPVLAMNADAPGVLLVGGSFTSAGGNPNASRIATWNGTAWGALNGTPISNGSVRAIAYSGGKVYAGGTFLDAGGNANADYLAVWDGSGWAPFCTSTKPGPAITATVSALQVVGNTLYVGGGFANGAGLDAADFLVGCDLTTGAPSATVQHDGDINSGIYALTAVRSLAASGTDVFVGTDAVNVAGIPTADHLVRWNGSAWSAVGSNTAGSDGWFPTSAFIYALAVNGPMLFAAGSFQNADGAPTADQIAVFNGTTWGPVGSDGAGNGPLSGQPNAAAVFRGKVVTGGNFTSAGGDTHAVSVAAYALTQPDARIGRREGGPFVGDNVYSPTGAGESQPVSIRRGHKASAYVSIENDGLVAAAYTVKGTGAARGITVQYFRGATNITAAVKAGTYSSGAIAARSSLVIRMDVTAAKTSAASAAFLVRLTSLAGTAPDAVRAVVTAH